MYIIIDNVNEEGEIYQTSEPLQVPDYTYDLDNAIENAFDILEMHPNDSIRITVAGSPNPRQNIHENCDQN